MNVVLADSDNDTARLFTSLQLRFLGMQRGQRGPLPCPIAPGELDLLWTPAERAGFENMLKATAAGSPPEAKRKLDAIVQQTSADELIVASAIHDHSASKRSYELPAAF